MKVLQIVLVAASALSALAGLFGMIKEPKAYGLAILLTDAALLLGMV